MSVPILNLIAQFSALIVCVVCVILVLHPQYNDGFFGRIGLSIMGVAAFARAVAIFSGDVMPVSNVGAMLWVGLALFLAKHMINFYKHKDCHDADVVNK